MTEYYLPFGPEIKLGQQYGARPGLTPNPPGGHNGDDWLTPVGTPVRSPGNGTVVFAGQFDDTYADNFGWNLNYGGNMVVLNMDGDVEPYFEFGHLLEIRVVVGQRVSAGEIFALTGNSDGGTGISSGPHCHVGCLPYNFDLGTNTYGRVNPRLWMKKYYTSETDVILKEWYDMTSPKELFDAVWTGGMIFNNELQRDEHPATVLGAMTDRIVRQQLAPLRNQVASQDAQIQSLVGALTAMSKGEAFDEAKLLVGIRAAAASGVKDAIDSIETTVTIK